VKMTSRGLLSIALAGFVCLPCWAQLRPCSGAAEPGQKVLVDDISGAQSVVLSLLKQRIDAALVKLQLESRAAGPSGAASGVEVERVRALRCSERHPSDGSAFTTAIARELNNNEVVLEVWAETTPLPPAEGPGLRALVGYALVPLRHYVPTSAQGVVIVESKAPSVDSPADLLALLDQSGTLAIYTAIGSGVRFLFADDFDQARTQLCLALSRLEKIRNPSPDDADLRQAVRDMAQDTVRRAVASPGYHGALRLATPASCTVAPL
jgi:hypothetical protein